MIDTINFNIGSTIASENNNEFLESTSSPFVHTRDFLMSVYKLSR